MLENLKNNYKESVKRYDAGKNEQLLEVNSSMLFNKLIWVIDDVCRATTYKKGTIYNLVSSGSIPYRKRRGKVHQKTFSSLYEVKKWHKSFEGIEVAEKSSCSTLKEVWETMQRVHFPLLATSTKAIWLRRYEPWKKLEKLPYSGTHILRHGMATLARKVGGGLDAVIAMTGHKDIKLADHYSKCDEEDQKDVSLRVMEYIKAQSAILNDEARNDFEESLEEDSNVISIFPKKLATNH